MKSAKRRKPDPKPFTFARFTLEEVARGDGCKCNACGGYEDVLHAHVQVGAMRSEGNRCRPCRMALGRCLMHVWYGDSPDRRDLDRLSHLRNCELAARIKAANDGNLNDETSPAPQARP